uniref:Uncharacterized protein n=1 Tax=Siphoviridae sp. ctiOl67 TaxID=2825622 RepID=A0A8S5QJR9_9CAUD|nr:MAG TPA: hypothetical protein [Siphoviridae sp. ctiOl67]
MKYQKVPIRIRVSIDSRLRILLEYLIKAKIKNGFIKAGQILTVYI